MTTRTRFEFENGAPPEPDTWWGEDGIDALIWADPLPYEYPLTIAPREGSEAPPSEGGAA